MRKTPIRRKGRTASEYKRIYGSKQRVQWVQELPCVGCGRTPSVNAHTVTGGTSYKADAHTIAPLCHSCHTKYDQHKAPFDTEDCRALVIAAAAETERQWPTRDAA